MARGKCVQQTSGSCSRVTLDPRFREADDQAAYHRYKSSSITLSRTINPVHLSYPVLDLFTHTSLCFILTLAVSFKSKLLFEFYVNLHINSSFTALTSYVNRRLVEITYQDCAELLQLSITGDKLHTLISDPDFDWYTANHFLSHTNTPFYVRDTSSLLKDARTIQHVLRTSIIPKAGDRVHITPLLSLTSFYILAHREFNAIDLIFRYIEHLTTICDPESKYQLQYPAPPDLQPPFYSNSSFNVLHSTRLHPGDGEAQRAEEEEAPAPALVPKPVPLRQHSQLDQLVERFDPLETRFDTKNSKAIQPLVTPILDPASVIIPKRITAKDKLPEPVTECIRFVYTNDITDNEEFFEDETEVIEFDSRHDLYLDLGNLKPLNIDTLTFPYSNPVNDIPLDKVYLDDINLISKGADLTVNTLKLNSEGSDLIVSPTEMTLNNSDLITNSDGDVDNLELELSPLNLLPELNPDLIDHKSIDLRTRALKPHVKGGLLAASGKLTPRWVLTREGGLSARTEGQRRAHVKLVSDARGKTVRTVAAWFASGTQEGRLLVYREQE
ncbi:hypothetical protein KFK09_022738 [Dendrobium nobile]|uniref:Uncharacterized protein n=1 Tax=Dendrobium nobile TaxID=94219 RepID=A0A8T3AKS4_DENNO|nr:hypothetical protein KFK09_022738 [Dendrobium nobile]